MRKYYETEWFTVSEAMRELSCIPQGIVATEVASGVIVSAMRKSDSGSRLVPMISRAEIDRRLARVPVPAPEYSDRVHTS